MALSLPNVSSRYGAPMGRADAAGDPDSGERFTLQCVRLDSGGYDSGGAYWGVGSRLYWAMSDSGAAEMFFRVDASSITAAFLARGGVRIGEPGAEAFRQRFPNWTRRAVREAAKDIVRADYPNARFYS